jgi:hypothetical protein
VWRGLQGLQILVSLPFGGIQRLATFRGLVKSMQVCDFQFNMVLIHIYVYIKGHFKAEKYVMSGKQFAMKLNYFGVASFKNL